jgi:hypothetical protein
VGELDGPGPIGPGIRHEARGAGSPRRPAA